MNQATTIAAYLREKKLPFAPDIALVLGSGLGGLAEQIENAVIIPYRSVPGFPCVHRAGARRASLWPGSWRAKRPVYAGAVPLL